MVADIDHDGKKERLEWECFSNCSDGYGFYQLKLYDDDGSVLWNGPRKNDFSTSLVGVTGDGDDMPVILSDIDGDGQTELIMGGQPHEPVSPGFTIFKWNGKKFIKSQNRIDLVWVDAPMGRTLKWMKIDFKEYGKRKKIWWAYGFEQLLNNEPLIVTVEGVKYPESIPFFNAKAQVRFTPTGAVIEKWIK